MGIFKSKAPAAAEEAVVEPANPDLPDGYDDEASPMFVPAELRPHYRRNQRLEDDYWAGERHEGQATYRFTPGRQECAAYWFRYELVTDPEAAGRYRNTHQHIRDSDLGNAPLTPYDLDVAVERITPAQREEWFHQRRLITARAEFDTQARQAATRQAQEVALRCRCCGDLPSTSPTAAYKLTDGRRVELAQGLVSDALAGRSNSMILCRPCAAAVEVEAIRSLAETPTHDGTPRSKMAQAALLDGWR